MGRKPPKCDRCVSIDAWEQLWNSEEKHKLGKWQKNPVHSWNNLVRLYLKKFHCIVLAFLIPYCSKSIWRSLAPWPSFSMLLKMGETAQSWWNDLKTGVVKWATIHFGEQWCLFRMQTIISLQYINNIFPVERGWHGAAQNSKWHHLPTEPCAFKLTVHLFGHKPKSITSWFSNVLIY